MSNDNINPFHELYFTESIDSEDFVKLFSDVLVQPALPIFKPGNVILKGLPGSGKTMMLNLLKPAIRLAYHNASIPFPVPSKFNKFIGAGINLIRSSISDFGQRPINNSKEDDLNELAIYFGDFLNYWIARDILDSLEELAGPLGKEIGIDLSPAVKEKFIAEIIKEDCWFGYLENVGDWAQLKDKLKLRTNTYRSYLNYNIDFIPENITFTKTSVGVPVITLIQKLRDCNVLKKDVQVFVRIDQFEELSWLDYNIARLGNVFQSVIHKLLAMRDSTVSYRIGTRPFDWQQGGQDIFGTSAKLEELRNYKEISIEKVLRKTEAKRGYIFPEFAEDIFYKRLEFVFHQLKKPGTDLIKQVFGEGYTAREKAKVLVKSSREKIIRPHADWPEPWINFLRKLSQEDPFSAKLAEAWAQQKGKSGIMYNIPETVPYPWEEKTYWVKERAEQAVIQIASRTQQGIIWSGKDDLLTLSGGNILAFLSLCQDIWEVWMRDEKNTNRKTLPVIDGTLQTIGVLEASRRYFENISATSEGKEIKLFIIHIGGLFYKSLTDDFKMSYPGENGFSLTLEDIESNFKIEKFLKDAADRGSLIFAPHTPKTKGKRRIKWYLNPLLSPYFRIPAVHTKEPMYINLNELADWLVKSKAFESSTIQEYRKKPGHNNNQMKIFE